MFKTLYYFILKIFRKIYSKFYKENFELRNWKMISNKSYSNDLIYTHLISDNACMIARIGSNEMKCITNYLGTINKPENKKLSSYVTGKIAPWWWEGSILKQMQQCAGFFPPTIDNIDRFCKLMLLDMTEVNILGSWLQDENQCKEELRKSKRVVLEDLEPFFTRNPWTKALEGKKVLVVHPFANTIGQQYKKRELLFDDNLLPDFELITLKAVQTIAGESSGFSDWFEALKFMKDEIDKTNYDICIIGCGAYGFPLAAHVKRMGKKAVHLGGVTQLLFGIIGSRWEDYIVWPYQNLFNEHWVRPSQIERPENADSVEGACYW